MGPDKVQSDKLLDANLRLAQPSFWFNKNPGSTKDTSVHERMRGNATLNVICQICLLLAVSKTGHDATQRNASS